MPVKVQMGRDGLNGNTVSFLRRLIRVLNISASSDFSRKMVKIEVIISRLTPSQGSAIIYVLTSNQVIGNIKIANKQQSNIVKY